jgi:colanic acid/amylovoran biosynthesis protein
MGARTHAAIAALSGGVPTISIAYSVKAQGINKDIFSNDDPVLETSKVSSQTMGASLVWLLEHEQELKEKLSLRVPELQQAVRNIVSTL